jgi:uncharacterized protein YbcV (DUF1398 family)
MFTEEFYNQEIKDKDVIDFFYVATLQMWLTHNDLNVYDDLLTYFEEQENYLICQGVHKAIAFIEKTVEDRFDGATKLSNSEDGDMYSFEEHKRISNEIFKDVVKEVYEKQIGDVGKSSGK